MVANRYGGRDVGFEVPLNQVLGVQKELYFTRASQRNISRAIYDTDWGDCMVDQILPDDPGPINSGTFKPVTRWIVLYRTPEAGQDGTHEILVSDVRAALTGAGTSGVSSFIIKEMHVWVAPNAINTHFSAVLYTQDDEANGILGGSYSDIASLTKMCKFRVMYRGEGMVKQSTDSASVKVLALGGSAKWNGIVYAKIQCYD